MKTKIKLWIYSRIWLFCKHLPNSTYNDGDHDSNCRKPTKIDYLI